ncbi:MAG: Cof-type HAD-IIB family hydrolase [bacterium]|nr:Cof-type HAD-IIB family hydrolase [bacterium]
MIKLIVTDIDGTILRRDFKFNQEVKDCISDLTKRGIKVVLVTGRMHSCTEFIAEELKLDTPIVSYQGGFIKYQDEILYNKTVNPKSAKEIINWARENNIHINIYLDDELYVEQDNDTIKKYAQERKAEYKVASFDSLNLENINKLLIIDYSNPDIVTEYKNYLSEKYPELNFVKSMPFFCEVCNKEATKKNAVEYLKKLWNIKTEEVMASGDQNNDLSLLDSAGIKIAMGNATDELKAVATYVTDTVENNGFVKAVERFVYNNGKN